MAGTYFNRDRAGCSNDAGGRDLLIRENGGR